MFFTSNRTSELQQRINNLEKRLKEKDKQIEHLLVRRSVIEMLKENIPIQGLAREKYVADISIFYVSIFKDKITHFISLQKEALSQMGRPDREYEIYRSNINCFLLIDDWMQTLTNEHLGDLEEKRSAAELASEFVGELKVKY